MNDRKFILVMIDGFGFENLNKTEYRYIPFISKLLKKFRYNLSAFNSGIPSTTPFVQAGIFYNYNRIIPGFRFYDKENGREIDTGLPLDALYLEGILRERGGKGILEGGSSIGNCFKAGAIKSWFTLSGIYNKSKIKGLFDILKILISTPTSIFRVLFFSIREFFVEIYESLKEHASREKYANYPIFYPYFPFYRMGVNAVFREIAFEAAKQEIKRGSPKICVNFNGYDWVSHYRGPYKKSSMLVLRDIDKRVKKLYRKAMKKGYDFYIFSDHGNVDAIPFNKIYNKSLYELITNNKIRESERSDFVDYTIIKFKVLYDSFTIPLKLLVDLFLRTFKLKKANINESEIHLNISSCIAHVYFNKKKERLNLDEINRYYPGLVEKLVNHPGIGIIIVNTKEGAKLLNRTGSILLSKDLFEGEDFLSKYGDRDRLLEMIKNFVKIENFGDLFLIGAIINEKIISFEEFHLGSHDGFGLGQEIGFFVSKEGIGFNSSDSRVLYDIFAKYQ